MEKDKFEEAKKKYLAKVGALRKKYTLAKDMATREYIKHKLLDLIFDMGNRGFLKKSDTKSIYDRINNIDNYGRFYNYSLAQNLKEQIIIIQDSIRASPLHQKKLEIKNTTSIQFQDPKKPS